MITAFYAAILALVFLALSLHVVMGRWDKRIAFGTGRDDDMVKRVRAHGNFAEYVPFTLILLMFAEMQAAPLWSIHLGGGMLVLGRLLHVWGVMTPKVPSVQRVAGMVLTFTVILGAALWSLWHFGTHIAIG